MTVQVQIPQVTENTRLRFEFDSNDAGEIQGIGFDNNNTIDRGDAARFFQVDGSQSFGNNVSQSGSNDVYEIAVGDFFTGNFNFLTFGNDHDVANPNAQAQYSNIELFEANNPTPPSVSDDLFVTIDGTTQSKEVEVYGGADQNPSVTVTVSNNNQRVNLQGNGWRKLDITDDITGSGYEIDATTRLKFEFDSTSVGEVIGLGFDNNDVISTDEDSGNFLQVAGNQNWGIEDLSQYFTGSTSDGFDSYSILLSQVGITGEFDFLTIGNDHDVSNPNAASQFRNISLG